MIKEYPVDELKPGMVVVDTGLSWAERPYLYAQPGVLSELQIASLRHEGYASAFIDTDKGPLAGTRPAPPTVSLEAGRAADLETEKRLLAHALRVDRPTALGAGDGAEAGGEAGAEGEAAPRAGKVPLRVALKAAQSLYEDSIAYVRAFLKDARLGRQIAYEKSEALVEGIIDSVMQNEDALLSLRRVRDADEYTYTHCLHVTVLATVFGRFLGLPRGRLNTLAKAALFHDLGKARIPAAILHKAGRLSEREFAQVRSHPALGVETIRALGRTVPEEVLRGIAEHHERYDGSGYPDGLRGEAVAPFAAVIGVVDVYDALTSERVYRKGLLAHEALKVIYGMRERDFSPLLIDRFIKCLGIYPVGSLVRLSNECIAVASGSNSGRPLEPLVRVIIGPKLKPIQPHSIDLALGEGDGEPLRVVEVLDHRRYGIDPAQYMV